MVRSVGAMVLISSRDFILRLVATEKEQIRDVPGDVTCISVGEKHWHGAVKRSTFSHLYVMSSDSNTAQLED